MRQQNEILHSAHAVRRAPVSPEAGPRLALPDGALLALRGERSGPQVVVIMPAREERKEFAARLSASGYVVAIAGTACEALEYAEQELVDGMVLDLDASYAAGARQAMISGFRLLELLWRAARACPVALVVLTVLDYAEIDDAQRRYIDALLNRSLTTAQALARLDAALARVSQRRQSGRFALAAAFLPAGYAD